MGKGKDLRIENCVLIGLLLAIVLFIGSNHVFIGSVYVQCNNFEPKNFNEFATAITSLNGAVSNIDPFIIQAEGVVENYELYKSQSSLGNLYVVPMNDMTCSAFLERVNNHPFHQGNLDISRGSDVACVTGYAIINNVCQFNVCWPSGDVDVYETLTSCNDATGYTTTNFMSVERRQILNTGAGYMFCNHENNLAIIAPSVNEFTSYVSKYEVCTPSEPRQEPTTNDENESDNPVVIDSPTIQTGEGELVKDKDNKSNVYNAVLFFSIVLLGGFLVYKKLLRGRK